MLITFIYSCRRDDVVDLPLMAFGSHVVWVSEPMAHRYELFLSPPYESCFSCLFHLSQLSGHRPVRERIFFLVFKFFFLFPVDYRMRDYILWADCQQQRDRYRLFGERTVAYSEIRDHREYWSQSRVYHVLTLPRDIGHRLRPPLVHPPSNIIFIVKLAAVIRRL